MTAAAVEYVPAPRPHALRVVCALPPMPSRDRRRCQRPPALPVYDRGRWALQCLRCHGYSVACAMLGQAAHEHRAGHVCDFDNPRRIRVQCRRRSKAAAHYRDDGTCRCDDVDDIVAAMHVAAAAAVRWQNTCASLGELLGAIA